MHHVKERVQQPSRKPFRFEEEPCSWTVHVAVRDSIKRELMYTPLRDVDSPGARAHIKAESFLRLLDMLFQILPQKRPGVGGTGDNQKLFTCFQVHWGGV